MHFDLNSIKCQLIYRFLTQHSNGTEDSDGKSSPSGSSYSGIPMGSYPIHPPPPTVPSISKLDIYSDPNVFADLDQIAINVSIDDRLSDVLDKLY